MRRLDRVESPRAGSSVIEGRPRLRPAPPARAVRGEGGAPYSRCPKVPDYDDKSLFPAFLEGQFQILRRLMAPNYHCTTIWYDKKWEAKKKKGEQRQTQEKEATFKGESSREWRDGD